MEATPREGEAAKGGEPQGGGERDIEHGCELARYPFRRETSGMVLPMRKSGDEYLYI